MEITKIFIHESGDNSVGIGDVDFVIELPYSTEFYNKEDRENARLKLRESLLFFMDDISYIRFNDECCDCFTPFKSIQNKCENKGCISYYKNDECRNE